MKILFVEPYPTEGPSSRYRVEQYIPYLQEKGIECVVRPFVSSEFYKILYKKGYYFRKTLFFFQSCVKRLLDMLIAIRCDIVFIHLEAFPLGLPIFELVLAKIGKKVIYDLDDAIYMGITSPSNKFLKFLKYPSKVKRIIRISRQVITCNEYLADYARQFNKNVSVIHTSVNTDKFMPKSKGDNQRITIGWIGSHSTTLYLKELRNVFYRLSLKHKFDLKIIGAATHNIEIPSINIIYKDWRLEDEIEEFQSLDIGVYPLPDNKWTAGKTGFKTIQYMSVGIPSVVSDAGPNRVIVEDGVSGYLAKTEDEWIEKLSKLIADSELRKRIGFAGRETAVAKFSLQVNAPRLFDIIQKVYSED